MIKQTQWRKSSYSGQETHCVELSSPPGLIRDSKDCDGPVLRADVAAFVRAVKAGRFDR
ncbi:DUF397 domain-containing protein [Saccharopolyspora shandongensis]|uniref:DUF397 domain-containing protein n=1 Tax=Saccharopolyspora shandongensis TaxID=418495 RepID=A0A1H3DL80_9PSEU|nr:DUF397 domain-containing protein [Saccharopolyspora shandongensis]SDX66878.1 protein of unknown function [Saccharopolyspora shandongensis]